jgi:hypothetical protein
VPLLVMMVSVEVVELSPAQKTVVGLKPVPRSAWLRGRFKTSRNTPRTTLGDGDQPERLHWVSCQYSA